MNPDTHAWMHAGTNMHIHTRSTHVVYNSVQCTYTHTYTQSYCTRSHTCTTTVQKPKCFHQNLHNPPTPRLCVKSPPWSVKRGRSRGVSCRPVHVVAVGQTKHTWHVCRSPSGHLIPFSIRLGGKNPPILALVASVSVRGRLFRNGFQPEEQLMLWTRVRLLVEDIRTRCSFFHSR